MGKKKRLTVSIGGDSLEWVDQMIEKHRFHNYQHAIDYCLRKIYEEEFERYKHVNVFDDHATIYDVLRSELVNIYFRGKAWCEKCEAHDCNHTRFALSLPKVVDPLVEKGWVVVEGKVLKTPNEGNND